MTSSGKFFPARPSVRYLILGLLLTLTAILSIDSLRRESITYDEPLHLIGGYASWKFGDHRLQVSHGALPQRLFSLPLLFAEVRFPDRSSENWRHPGYLAIAQSREFLYGKGVDSDALIFRCRLMAVLVALATVVAVYAWGSVLINPTAGLIGAFFCALSPTLLAHGRLMTSDLITALAYLMSGGCFWLLLRRLTWWRLLSSSVCFGLLMVSKMSGALFVPMAVLMFLGLFLLGRPWQMSLAGLPWRSVSRWKERLLVGVGVAAAHAAISLAIIWSFYNWRHAPAPDWDPALDDYTVPRAEIFSDLGHAQPIIDTLDRLQILPDAYVYGLAHTIKNSVVRPSFLNGEYSPTGWWYYFPYCFLVKSTPAELGAMTLGAGLLIWLLLKKATRRRGLAFLYRTSPLWILLLVYWAAALSTNLNIGHRHLLPIYPPLFVLAGALLCRLVRHGRWGGALVAVVLGTQLLALGVHPHYLAYFNRLAGGPEQGYLHLSDSNVDWGQDLPSLARWLREHQTEVGTGNLYLVYFGMDLPERHGIRAYPIPSITNRRLGEQDLLTFTGGTFCISATTLISPAYGRPAWTPELETQYLNYLGEVKRRMLNDPPNGQPENRRMWKEALQSLALIQFNRLRAQLILRKPYAAIGHSILVYRLSDSEVRAAVMP